MALRDGLWMVLSIGVTSVHTVYNKQLGTRFVRWHWRGCGGGLRRRSPTSQQAPTNVPDGNQSRRAYLPRCMCMNGQEPLVRVRLIGSA